MTNEICLDKNYSTTQLLTQEKPILKRQPDDKFETILFLPENGDRKGEGGLRTKGYFKKSHEDKPLISIITVVFNGEQYLEQTIQSVINQSYDNVEYIIIDGGSTDGTLDIIKKYEDRIDYWVSEKDDGIYDAMNKGITLATGKVIGLINADDWYEKRTIKEVVDIFNENKHRDIVYGLLRHIKNEQEYKIEAQNHNFLYERMIPHPTCFVKKAVYNKLNNFSTMYRASADYDFMIRAKLANFNFIKIDEVLANFRNEGISNSSKVGAMESLKIKRKNKLISLKYYLFKTIFFKIREQVSI